MRLLALDIGMRMGWAAGAAGERPSSGSVLLKRAEEGRAVAFANLMAYLSDLWADERPSLVVKEAPIPLQAFRHLGNAEATVRMTLGLHSVAEGICHRYGVRCEDAAVQTVRRHFIGRASMGARADTKGAVIARCHLLKLMPPDCHDDNRADALATWDYAAATIKGRRVIEAGELYLFGEEARNV
jgi:hypothetical protein